MLVVTEQATTVILQLVDRPEMPDDAGLRIASTEPGNPKLTVTTDTPEEGDQVVESNGARVYLEPESAQLLDDKILDARVDDSGGVQFLVGAQS
jgi:iron-sulfur cluster assembly protein